MEFKRMNKSMKAEIACWGFGVVYLCVFIATHDFDFIIISNVFFAASFAIEGNEK
jgi:hypothetical protein